MQQQTVQQTAQQTEGEVRRKPATEILIAAGSNRQATEAVQKVPTLPDGIGDVGTLRSGNHATTVLIASSIEARRLTPDGASCHGPEAYPPPMRGEGAWRVGDGGLSPLTSPTRNGETVPQCGPTAALPLTRRQGCDDEGALALGDAATGDAATGDEQSGDALFAQGGDHHQAMDI